MYRVFPIFVLLCFFVFLILFYFILFMCGKLFLALWQKYFQMQF